MVVRYDAGTSSEEGRHVPDGLDRAADCAGHLRTPRAGAVDHPDLRDGPTRPVGAHDHLEWPPGPSVFDPECDQVLSPGRALRAEVAQAERSTSPDLGHEHAIG